MGLMDLEETDSNDVDSKYKEIAAIRKLPDLLPSPNQLSHNIQDDNLEPAVEDNTFDLKSNHPNELVTNKYNTVTQNSGPETDNIQYEPFKKTECSKEQINSSSKLPSILKGTKCLEEHKSPSIDLLICNECSNCSTICFSTSQVLNSDNVSTNSYQCKERGGEISGKMALDSDYTDWTPGDQDPPSNDNIDQMITSASSSTCSSPSYKSKSSSGDSTYHNNNCTEIESDDFCGERSPNSSQNKAENCQLTFLSNQDSNTMDSISDTAEAVNITSDNMFDVTLFSEKSPEVNTSLKIGHTCLSHPEYLSLKHKFEETEVILEACHFKTQKLEQEVLEIGILRNKVSILTEKCSQQERELELSKQEHNLDSRALASLKKETEHKIDSLKKQFEAANKEREAMVMRYAKSEKTCIDLMKDVESVTKKWKDLQKENESLLGKMKILTADKSRFAQTLDNKTMELSTAYKEIDRLKEEINSRDIKIKWVQNKVKTEMDLHKECPGQIDRLNERISELGKELEKNLEEIGNCKKRLQEYETNTATENQIKEEQAKLILERHEQSEREVKVKYLQQKNQALIEENNSLSFQVQNLELERFELDEKLSQVRSELQEGSNTIADLRASLVEFDSISNQLAQEREKVEKVVSEVERLRRTNEELMQDMATCRNREAEMLSFTQKLTTKNVQLQSEFSSVEAKASKLSKEQERADEAVEVLRIELAHVKKDLDEEKKRREEETRLLARQVAERAAKVEDLEAQLAEARSLASGLRNKHQASLRELQRELQQCHKKLEQYEEGGRGRRASSSPCSSSTSLNSLPDTSSLQVEVHPSVLVERILKLQTEVGKQQDKIDFLEEHNGALLEQFKKKKKLLQSYILREQAGTLTNDASDHHKAEMTKHGGIMASVYGSRSSDEGMTLELSLEINHKLQALLEDTLLKNITLKENIDTLGDEITRLKTLQS